MTNKVFFSALEHQFNSQQPMVAYRKPGSKTVTALLQKSDAIFFSDDYSESGFVMAPFDSREDAVLLPLSECEIIVLEDFVISTARSCETSQETSGLIDGSRKMMVSDKDKENHINLVQNGVEAIQKGQLDKVVLSRTESLTLSNANPINILKRLLQTYPTAFVYCWYHPKVGLWLGATPETLITARNNQFKTMALAGTQSYKGTLDVAWGKKEQEEQNIVTNFIINNLKASVGCKTLEVSKVETIKAGNLLHLKTDISGTLNPDSSSFEEILKALHPTPAVCGFSKRAAKQFILENESYDREFYTGFLGELNFKRSGNDKPNSNLFVNLRCVQLKQNQALVYVGGGITKDSNPEAEWQETVNKSQTIISILS